MEREKIIEIKFDTLYLETDYYCGAEYQNIQDIIDFLNKAKYKGATDIELKGGSYGGDLEYLEITPLKIKLESEEDFNKRLLEEEERKKRVEQRKINEEKELYLKLKQKFENNGI